ncbi:MAG: SDR family oxidoreductase [Chloroflexi bacterium]|nr:SDR family oxidoreductase [Chloroflexota bacterium]
MLNAKQYNGRHNQKAGAGMKLQNQVALVTGASRGMGRSIALAFAAEGAHVAVTGRAEAELAEVSAAISQAGGRCIALVADLSEPGAARGVYDQAVSALGPVDILVNNAGIGSSADPRPVLEFDDAFWDRTLYVNLTVPYLLCKWVLPSMIAKRHGRIIQVASIAGKVGTMHGAAYSASKHGLLGLSRTLAMETAAHGITVNAICPGPVHTLMNDKRIAYDAQRTGKTLEAVAAGSTPIGRRLEPDEIAPLAVYLASREASVMTGQAINIDGGVLMS